MIKKIRNQSIGIKILIFIGIVAVWLAIAYLINSSISGDIEAAENLHTLWLLSTLIIAVASGIVFGKNRD